jgi:AcrR family transcriptional regulator
MRFLKIELFGADSTLQLNCNSFKLYCDSITIKSVNFTLMNYTLFRFSPNIKKDTYLKDPFSSELGHNIIRESVNMIDEIGFEDFTFKKLAFRIETTEATIYRYFENKQKLLMYLTSWYWCWIEYQLALKNANIQSPVERLQNAIRVIAHSENYENEQLDMQRLFNIICLESSKSYMIKNVDDMNKSGLYFNYKKIVGHISDILLEINPEYRYPHMLISTMIEGVHHQKYFSIHLPSLTDKRENEDFIYDFYTQMTFSTISK